jgi:hypothetical protein
VTCRGMAGELVGIARGAASKENEVGAELRAAAHDSWLVSGLGQARRRSRLGLAGAVCSL